MKSGQKIWFLNLRENNTALLEKFPDSIFTESKESFITKYSLKEQKALFFWKQWFHRNNLIFCFIFLSSAVIFKIYIAPLALLILHFLYEKLIFLFLYNNFSSFENLKRNLKAEEIIRYSLLLFFIALYTSFVYFIL